MLLAEADKAEAEALAARKKGNETLEEAHAIKTTLESKYFSFLTNFSTRYLKVVSALS